MMCRCAAMPETGAFKKAEHLRKNRCSAFYIFSPEKFFWQKERGLDGASPLDKDFLFHHGFDCGKLFFQVTVYTQ